MNMKLEASWHRELEEEIRKPYISQLKKFLAHEKESGAIVYPPDHLVFNAFSQTPFAKVKVVIMGQDPYHGSGQAHGLSFSVPPGVPPPPSLKNIFKELGTDLGLPLPNHGSLISWAQQGVLLLNATLTVRAGEPKSHFGQGWEPFTDSVVRRLNEREEPLVFILWGKSAQEKYCHISTTRPSPHAILMAAHPSPYSATSFFSCRHFSKTNKYLKQWGKEAIDWSLPL